MTARSFCLLNNINDSTTGRFISNISTDEEIEMILSNHEEDKKIIMSKLVKAVYQEYIIGIEPKQDRFKSNQAEGPIKKLVK